jgi:undecaprenyl-diphosphatase
LTAIIPVLVLPTSTRIRRTQPNAGAHPLQMQPILSESDGRQRRARLASLRRPLLVALAATALATAFAYLGSEVLERDTSAIDTALLRAAKILRTTHPWLTSTMRDFSGLGSVAVLLVITLATAGYLWLLRAPRTALCVLGAVASGTLADALLKRVFGRARPDATLADFSVSSMSFPSGHASMSAIVFLTVGAMLASSRPSRPERVYILAVSAALTVLVGLSRVALGVHWPTDVLGGWAFGSAWTLVWVMVARQAEMRSENASRGRDG